MAFKVGDRVVIVNGPPNRVGEVHVVTLVTLIDESNCHLMHPSWYGHAPPLPFEFCQLSGASRVEPGRHIAYPSANLAHYRPDHDEKAEWTEELRRLCGVKGMVEA